MLRIYGSPGRRFRPTKGDAAGTEILNCARELHTRGLCGETLAMSRTSQQIDLSGRVVVFESLKKCRRGVFHAVPVPAELLDTRLTS